MESGAEGEVAAGEIPEIELIIRWREGWTVGDMFLRKSFNLVYELLNLMARASTIDGRRKGACLFCQVTASHGQRN